MQKKIESDLINAEFAIIEEMNRHSKIFKKIKDDYLRDRFDDVRDACRRILENLGKKEKNSKSFQKSNFNFKSIKSSGPFIIFKIKTIKLVSIFGRGTLCNCRKIFIYSHNCWN